MTENLHHILRAQQFSREWIIEEFLLEAERQRRALVERTNGHELISVFTRMALLKMVLG